MNAWMHGFRRGDDKVGNPHRAQISQFEFFDLILLLKLIILDAWMHGCADARAHGCADAWPRGCADACVHGMHI